MSHMHALHLQDTNFEAATRSGRFLPMVITAAIVLAAGGALLFFSGDEPPRSIPEPSASTDPASGAPLMAEPGVAGDAAALPASGEIAAATVSVPAGTTLSLEIVEPVTSFDAEVGTRVVATLTSAVIVDSEVALESGTRVIGRVTETMAQTAANESPVAAVVFESAELDGRETAIQAELKGEHLDLAPGRRLELQLAQAVSVPVEQGG